jgi:hypothetical protein
MERFIETHELNKGRRHHISSGLSEGQYQAVIQEGLPHVWPQETPY